MNFLRNFGAAVVASCFVASSAAAVTVTVTHTGYVSSIGSSNSVAHRSPSSTQTIRDNDQFTLTYSFDTAAPVAVDNSYLNSRSYAYDLSGISISFASGFASTLLPHRMGVYARSNASTGEEYLSFDLQSASGRTGLSSVPTNTLFVANDPITGSGPAFAASLSEVADNIAGFAFKYGGYYADPDAIGASSADCGGTHFCYVAFNNVSAGSIVGTKPPLPPVSPVPVPAPFLMLGMAMAGLIGFGRRAKA